MFIPTCQRNEDGNDRNCTIIRLPSGECDFSLSNSVPRGGGFRRIIDEESRNNRLSAPMEEYTCGIGSLRRDAAGRVILSLRSIDYLSTRTVKSTPWRGTRDARTYSARKRLAEYRRHCRSGRSCTEKRSAG